MYYLHFNHIVIKHCKIFKVMAISESSRLHASLKKEKVPVKRLVINQVLPHASDCKFCSMKRKVIRSDTIHPSFNVLIVSHTSILGFSYFLIGRTFLVRILFFLFYENMETFLALLVIKGYCQAENPKQ